ncbi:MAG: hypothetical protein GX556_12085 [Fibrobacter sp.]|nr:hypothetical protein [Fibrobacter sp.]
MPAAAHALHKKIHSRQPIVPFRKPKVARECKTPGTFTAYKTKYKPYASTILKSEVKKIKFTISLSAISFTISFPAIRKTSGRYK